MVMLPPECSWITRRSCRIYRGANQAVCAACPLAPSLPAQANLSAHMVNEERMVLPRLAAVSHGSVCHIAPFLVPVHEPGDTGVLCNSRALPSDHSPPSTAPLQAYSSEALVLHGRNFAAAKLATSFSTTAPAGGPAWAEVATPPAAPVQADVPGGEGKVDAAPARADTAGEQPMAI